MNDEDRDYVDTPAVAVSAVCRRCDGDGWFYRRRAALFQGRMVESVKPEPCDECAPAGEAPTGRVNLATGPGARVRPWERVRVPGVDDWGRPRS
jgi:hypothetical protein